jgi:nitroreductase
MDFALLPELTRSCRRFQEKERIPEKRLREIIGAARFAPSAANLQLLRFSFVSDRKPCDELFPFVNWAGYLRDWDGPVPGERPAAWIVVYTPEEKKPFTGIDTGIAAAYMVLAARDAGYGSCMILSFDRAEIASRIGIPGYEVGLLIALGVPAEEIVIEEYDGSIEYWRSEDGTHHVPKLSLDSLIVETGFTPVDREDV